MSAQRDRATAHAWLHDDAEEDLVGADWHQEAIRTVVNSLRDLASERGWPWHVGDQLTLVGWKPDGTSWRPCPDIMIHTHAGAAKREEISARDEGLPALVVEVASRTTWRYDADASEGKAFGYLSMGVPEYLVFDPRGTFLAGQCRGWRREGDAIHDWLPSPDGRYSSPLLGISFKPEEDLLRIFDPDGNPVAFDYENAHRVRILQQENEALRAELARLRTQNYPRSDPEP